MYRIIRREGFLRSVRHEGIANMHLAQILSQDYKSLDTKESSYTIEEYEMHCDNPALGRGLADTFRDMAAQGCQDRILPDAALLLTLASIREIVEDQPGTAMLSELVEMISQDYQHMADMQEVMTQASQKIAELEAMLAEALAHLRGK